ncbi:MAG TPA: hypothetical protein DHV28_10760 [Ignavibacteriales bacterium]|nr:hypothetical protein [Ignavibacteriales bacterium]
MVNTILLKHKTLGSAALRCGASQFGVKNMGKFSNYPSLFVAVFKTQEKRSKFLNYLRSQNLTFQTDYYYKYAIHKNTFVYMVFVKLYRCIPSEKIGFNSFKQLCSSKAIQIYSNQNYFHPHSITKYERS